jgi:hypothetical protein
MDPAAAMLERRESGWRGRRQKNLRPFAEGLAVLQKPWSVERPGHQACGHWTRQRRRMQPSHLGSLAKSNAGRTEIL